jgi:hypothetical protein
MTVHIRRDQEIHREEGGWFTARWHLSFDRYHDPEHMGFGNMRLFNDHRRHRGRNGAGPGHQSPFPDDLAVAGTTRFFGADDGGTATLRAA